MGKTAKIKKILIYSPYWDIRGGGEKYLLDIARSLAVSNRVFLVADKNLKKKAEETFSISLENIEFLDPSIFRGRKFYGRFFFLRQFDVCFYMTDGSLFFPGARRNYLIIQSPMHIPEISIPTRFKLSGWKLLCYSTFMQKIIRDRLNKDSVVLAPCVDPDKFSVNLKKEKYFLSVGRFFASVMHEKRHDFLIEFFRKNHGKNFKGWKLLICGNLTEGSGREMLVNLKSRIRDLPAEIFVNISFSKLKEFYAKSSIYWHAAGFEVDHIKNPEKMEHFGITAIEAMANKTVPLAFSGGGLTDIIKDGKNGFLWQTEKEFLEKNLKLLKNPSLLKKIGSLAAVRAADFSFAAFREKVNDLV